MKKRLYHCPVCSCSPDKGVFYLESHLLKAVVNQGIHPIRCASTCGHKVRRGLLLGNLCAEAHHPHWALRIWKFTIGQIHDKDYDDWIDVRYFNTRYVCFRDVISDGWCEIIGRRMDDVERQLGISDAHGRNSWEYRAGDGWYNDFFCEKFECDHDWEEERDSYLQFRNSALEEQHLECLFRDAQGNHTSPEDFFDYWNDYDPANVDLHFKIDDWDE